MSLSRNNSGDFFCGGFSFFYSRQCSKCANYSGSCLSCKAFPEKGGIPPEIWSGEVSHTKPYPGDNGILFEEK